MLQYLIIIRYFKEIFKGVDHEVCPIIFDNILSSPCYTHLEPLKSMSNFRSKKLIRNKYWENYF